MRVTPSELVHPIGISRIPGIFFQDDYMRELGIDPKTQLISIYRNPYSYEIHSGRGVTYRHPIRGVGVAG